ncbi:MAPEG family protein YecN [Aeromonas salmonicida subsp. pectinolytica 34mel]|jgi:hypothetical protein|nr:MAPEG family protein YecN [Aeromonas salmonicida subsp. pectinolytica 34mel]MDR6993587.1 putative membrane protein YecN with MAPEG domain [Aeromonas salmonicida]MDR7020143.1 putative membrane protein YecN with MAPEG domain [Aeromonas salmonicida]
MMMHITLIYAGLLGLLFLLLSFWVVKRRAQFKVMIGEGEAPEMRSAIRAHGNFAEYVPLTLLLMALCELAGVGAFWLHVGGLCLLVGRILHAIGIQIPKAPNMPRLFGTLLFWLALGLFSVLALVQGLSFG